MIHRQICGKSLQEGNVSYGDATCPYNKHISTFHHSTNSLNIKKNSYCSQVHTIISGQKPFLKTNSLLPSSKPANMVQN